MFSNPLKNIKAFGLREDNIVADLGAGTGFYSLALGNVLTKGKVYAVEIAKDFLSTITNKVQEANLKNIDILWGDVEKIGGTKLGDGVVDAVVASNVLFQLEHKDKFIEEVKRILKDHGRVLLVEWAENSAGIGIKGVIQKSEARSMFEKRGFKFERDIDAGAYHYGMILSKS